MQYRKMPNTKEQLSALGYGVMRMPTKRGKAGGMTTLIDAEKSKKLIRYAIDNGVNYLDTAYPYHRGTSESFLGEHVLPDGYREKVFIATKMPTFSINKTERFNEIFEKQLKKLKVDYIDYYLMHSLDGSTWGKMKGLGVIEWMDKVRAQGKVKKIGFSFHGLHDEFKQIVDEYDWEFVQVQYNILDIDFQAGIKGIRYAHSKGLGVIVM
ncbi:MAG: aldo/keto reductase, partial [Clostridia bacterium]|nr:aldo/keto reductase [Clostridia bacterium]